MIGRRRRILSVASILAATLAATGAAWPRRCSLAGTPFVSSSSREPATSSGNRRRRSIG